MAPFRRILVAIVTIRLVSVKVPHLRMDYDELIMRIDGGGQGSSRLKSVLPEGVPQTTAELFDAIGRRLI